MTRFLVTSLIDSIRDKAMWKHTGHARPDFAYSPAGGEESVWDYPRPPKLDSQTGLVRVEKDGRLIAETDIALRVLETASPPTVYLPVDCIDGSLLVSTQTTSFCEWKGQARYYCYAGSAHPSMPIAWSYPNPKPPLDVLAEYISFYPGRVDCFVNGEAVRPQSSEFYGGWITDNIIGPFKGDPGTGHW